jgi:hypothetical protein
MTTRVLDIRRRVYRYFFIYHAVTLCRSSSSDSEHVIQQARKRGGAGYLPAMPPRRALGWYTMCASFRS